MKIKFLGLDYFLLFAVIALSTIGILFIYSSGINSSGVLVTQEYVKQIFFAISGLILLTIMIFIDYRKIKQFAIYLYCFLLLVLIYTRIFGTKVNGARSWIGIGNFGVQPSEFGKVIFIVFLAWFLDYSAKMQPLKRFSYAALIMCLPMGLILLQPDLGTASVYFPIFLLMCYAAGIPKRYLGIILGIGVFSIIFTVLPIWESKIYQKTVPFLKVFRDIRLLILVIIGLAVITLVSALGYLFFRQNYYYWITYVFGILTVSLIASLGMGEFLEPYQISRLIIFMNPQVDPQGTGWNIIQSKIAIGSGYLTGQGYLNGTHCHARYLPQQSTDFIFSILSEEWGFLGGLTVFILYGIILARGLVIVHNATNVYGYYISIGIVAMIFFHFFVNVGMVMGMMPITGIPLLFLSYGGSSLWTAMTSVGLLMSINLRRTDF